MPPKKASKYRELPGSVALLGRGVSLILFIYLLLYLIGFSTSKVIFLLPVQFLAGGVGLVLFLVFLWVPINAGARRHSIPWYDILIMASSTGSALYFAATYHERMFASELHSTFEFALAIILLFAIMEATRRLLGMAVFLLTVMFFFYPMVCQYLPALIGGRGYSFHRLVEQFVVYGGIGVFGEFMKIAFVVLFIFLIFAGILQETGAGDFFLDLATGIAGNFRGGPAKIAIIASSMLGTMTGSAVANVAGTGAVTIPLMKATGYESHFSGAVEAVASTGGQIIPPVMGVTAFIMADIVGVPYWSICMAALLPGILYYIALFLQVDFQAAKIGLIGLPRTELPSVKKTLLQGGHFLLSILLLVYLLAFLQWSPTRSCLYALVALVLLSYLRKKHRPTIANLIRGIEFGIQLLLTVAISCASISIIAAAITMTGLGPNLAGALVEMSHGSLGALLILAGIASYILGMGLPTFTGYILLSLLIAPSLVTLGVPLMAAHMFILYFGLSSMITPPVCPAIYAAAAIADAPIMKTGFTSMKLGIVLLSVPFVFVYEPALILQGPLNETFAVFVSSAAGIYMLAGAFQGYLLRPTHLLERILLGVAGIMLFFPGWVTDIIGLGLGVVVMLSQLKKRRTSPACTTPVS
jgi:TRAP transporter 4TM/12TM fusion protein